MIERGTDEGSVLNIQNDRLMVRVRPNARQTRVVKVDHGVALIDVAAPPEGNRANSELVRFLQRMTKRSCRIILGTTAKRKVVGFD